MRHWMCSLVVTATLCACNGVYAAETAVTHGEKSESEQVDPFPHPHVSEDGSWGGAMAMIILLGFFLPAAVIGPIVRSETPEEVPPAHSHDEPPGASGHHGHSGTHAEEPHH